MRLFNEKEEKLLVAVLGQFRNLAVDYEKLIKDLGGGDTRNAVTKRWNKFKSKHLDGKSETDGNEEKGEKAEKKPTDEAPKKAPRKRGRPKTKKIAVKQDRDKDSTTDSAKDMQSVTTNPEAITEEVADCNSRKRKASTDGEELDDRSFVKQESDEELEGP